jgi:ribosome-associated heat shock protein Hsp15
VAAECLVDHSLPPPPADDVFAAPTFTRERGAGRPTKRERRDLDRLRRPR